VTVSTTAPGNKVHASLGVVKTIVGVCGVSKSNGALVFENHASSAGCCQPHDCWDCRTR